MKCLTAACGSLLLSPIVVGVMWIGCSAYFFPLTAIDLDRGSQLFHDRCASCHSTQDGAGLSYGPNLSRIGHVASQRVPGLAAEEYLTASILTPNSYRQEGASGVMPADISAGLSREDVMSIVGFLTTLGGSPDSRRLAEMIDDLHFPEQVEHPAPNVARVEAGKKLFLGKAGCVKCHNLHELPGFDLRAPALVAAGKHDAEYLRQSICQPNRTLTPGYESYQVWLETGRVYTGRMLRDGAESIDLLVDHNSGARVVTIAKSEIEIDDDSLMILRSQLSAMPSQKSLRETEIEDLVAFLKTLH